jgi:hypothetical protein
MNHGRGLGQFDSCAPWRMLRAYDGRMMRWTLMLNLDSFYLVRRGESVGADAGACWLLAVASSGYPPLWLCV